MIVELGQVFTVKLNENPTTGYQWQLSVTNGLRIISSQYMAPSSGLMGAGGVHVWKIKAVGVGPQSVYGVYKKSWESYNGNEDHYYQSVKVVKNLLTDNQ